MRSIQFVHTGLATEVLDIVEAPTPNAGPGQVLVRVQARPINPSDLMFVRGLYGIRPQLPSPIGFEGAGVVEAVGTGVNIPLGTRVSFAALGSWAEYIVLPAAAVMPVPDSIALETACQLYVNPFTAVAILEQTGLQAGDWLLQTAGASSFGQLVIQLCKRLGIRTISTVRRPDNIAQLKALGADEVIDVSQEKLVKRVAEITGGQMVSRAIDAVGGDEGAEVLKCLSFGGELYIYGVLSLQPIPLNSGLLIFKNLSVRGFWLSEWSERVDKDTRKAVKTQVIELLSTGQLQAPVEQSYDLTQVRQACAHAERPGRSGKILLVG